MPPTVGLFINPGVVPAANDEALPRFNRSFEYDDVSDRYARFLIEETDPVCRIQARRDRSATIPTTGEFAAPVRARICAFVAAWNRPDAFRRVYSMIGTFVGLARRRRTGDAWCARPNRNRCVFSCRTEQGPEHLCRRLVDGEPNDEPGTGMGRLRGRARLGRGRP